MARIPSAGRTVDHMDGADLALGLQEDAAQFGHAPRHVLQKFRLRRNRIAKKRIHPGAHRSFRQCLVALPQLTFHQGLLLSWCVVCVECGVRTTGTTSHAPRHTHVYAAFFIRAGSRSTVKTTSGQTTAQMPHPVQDADVSSNRTG